METWLCTHLPALCRKSSEKEQWHLPSLLSGSCPSSSLPDAYQLNSFPYVPAAFKLLPQRWSLEQVCLSKSMHRLLKMNCLEFQLSFVSFSHNPLSFYSQKLCAHFFLALERTPGYEAWCGGWDPSLFKGTSAAKISLLIFTCHTCETRHSMSLPLLPVLMWFLFYILSYRTLYSLISGGSKARSFVVVILMRL